MGSVSSRLWAKTFQDDVRSPPDREEEDPSKEEEDEVPPTRQERTEPPDTQENQTRMPIQFQGILTDNTPEGSLNKTYSLNLLPLIELLKKNLAKTYLQQTKHVTPLPGKKSYQVRKQYIEMNLDILDRSGHHKRHQFQSVAEFLDHAPTDFGPNTPRQIMLRGGAGFGKTTLVNMLVQNWSSGRDMCNGYSHEETFLIFMRLNTLKPGDDVEKVLLNLIHDHTGFDPSFIRISELAVQNLYTGMVLMLDGYDEICLTLQKQVRGLLKSRKNGPQSIFRSATIIIVSRFETDRKILYLFDRQFKMVGFSEENLEEFVKKYGRSKDEPFYKSLSKLYPIDLEDLPPLLILIIMELQEEVDTRELHEDFFRRVIFKMAERANLKDKTGLANEKIPEKFLRVGEYSDGYLLKNTFSLPAPEFRETLGEDLEFVVRSGIWKRILSTPFGRKECYEPLNKLFMFSLGSFYLQETWLKMTSDSERREFLDTKIKLDENATVVIDIVQGGYNDQTCICVRFIDGTKSPGFYWRIRGSEVNFLLTYERFRENSFANELLRFNVEQLELEYKPSELILDTLKKAVSLGNGYKLLARVSELLRNLSQRSFLVTYSRKIESRGQERILVDHLNKPDSVVCQTMYLHPGCLTSFLFANACSLEVSLQGSWTSMKRCNLALNRLLSLDLADIQKSENVFDYLRYLIQSLGKVTIQVRFLFKFKFSDENQNVRFDLGSGDVIVSEAVNCDVRNVFSKEELVAGSKIQTARFRWVNCTTVTISLFK